MATEKQLEAAKQNVKKAKAARRKRRDDESNPKQKQHASGSSCDGEFYRIEVRPKEEFIIFRNKDVGNKGGIERLAGKRPGGSWDTATWLVSKNCAHIENKRLVADKPGVKELFDTLGSPPVQIEGDIFKAKDRRSVSQMDQQAAVQKVATSANSKKAQAAGGHK